MSLFLVVLFWSAIIIAMGLNILGWIEHKYEYYRGAEYHKTRLICWLVVIIIYLVYL